jgi:hypothetical protein
MLPSYFMDIGMQAGIKKRVRYLVPAWLLPNLRDVKS